jgi:hypothetical protein
MDNLLHGYDPVISYATLCNHVQGFPWSKALAALASKSPAWPEYLERYEALRSAAREHNALDMLARFDGLGLLLYPDDYRGKKHQVRKPKMISHVHDPQSPLGKRLGDIMQKRGR